MPASFRPTANLVIRETLNAFWPVGLDNANVDPMTMGNHTSGVLHGILTGPKAPQIGDGLPQIGCNVLSQIG